MNLKPLNENLILERKEPESKTASGIILPDSKKLDKPSQGKVVAVSAMIEEVKAGDVVLFSKYAGTEIEIQGKDYLVVTKQDLIGVIPQ